MILRQWKKESKENAQDVIDLVPCFKEQFTLITEIGAEEMNRLFDMVAEY